MANEFIARKGLIALEASQITGSLNVSGGITGSLQGTSSWASNALTSSFVNTLNQNLIITGAVSIGTSSIGPSENTLTLGARDNASEGGQLGLNAPGGTYTSASFLDVYQNKFRILRGTNASSDAEYFNLNLHTGQLVFNKYLNTSSFAGTANAYLAIDTSGNVITTAGASVGSGDNLGNHTATQDLDLATFNIKNLGVITGSGNAQVSVGTYNFGQELSSTFSITGSGLIVSSSTLPTNHYNMVKIGNIELLDLNSLVSSNTFLMHNVDRFLVASGSEPIDLFFTNNKLLDHNGTQFDIYGGGANYAVRITSASSLFNNQGVFNALATSATAVNITHFAGWASAPSLPVSDIVYMSTSSLLLTTSSIRNFPTEVSRSAAAAGFGSGGGGGVTINNNVDDYIVTATGTSNTLNGESTLTFDGTTLTLGGNAVMTAIDVRNDPVTSAGEYAPGSHMARDWPAAGGPSLTAGNIVYFSGSSQWANAQANATGSSTRVLGVVTSNADPNEILLQGTITINTDLATYSVGQPVYLSPLTAGRVTNVPPSSSGHVARYVGWVVDTSRDQIYFNPDFTYIQL